MPIAHICNVAFYPVHMMGYCFMAWSAKMYISVWC